MLRGGFYSQLFKRDLLQTFIKSNSICTTDRLYIKRCVALRLGFVISVWEMGCLGIRDFSSIPNENLLTSHPPPLNCFCTRITTQKVENHICSFCICLSVTRLRVMEGAWTESPPLQFCPLEVD